MFWRKDRKCSYELNRSLPTETVTSGIESTQDLSMQVLLLFLYIYMYICSCIFFLSIFASSCRLSPYHPPPRIRVMASRAAGDCNVAAVGEGAQRQLHVLAVDDSSVDRAVIAGLLRTSKYRVTAVESGKMALELLGSEKKNVNMIITDYWMPGMTGFELLKKIKESAELKEIPVVIMSSENVPNRINRCLEEGAEDFLLKPIQQSDVSRLCSRLLK